MSVFRGLLELYWPVLLTAILIYVGSVYFWKKKSKKGIEHEEENTEITNENRQQADGSIEPKPALPCLPHVPYPGPGHTLQGGAKEFYRIVNSRRSVRQFSSRPVDPEIIKDIVKCAGTAPSGAHTEPWTYVSVTSSELKRSVREIVEREEEMNYLQRMARQWCVDLLPFGTNWNKSYLTDAPCLLLAFKQTHGERQDGSGKKQHYYNEISVAISVGIMLAAIQSAGLCSVITTPLNCGPQLRELLGRPTNEKLLVLAPVGYAHPDCLVPNLDRKPLSDILVEL